MKIVIFSDIHYSDNYKYETEPIKSRKLTMYSEPLVKKLIEKINHEIKPDIVLNLGDLIEDRNNSKKDKENLEYIWNILKQIKVPFYTLVGNHDLKMMKSKREVENILGYKNTTFSIDLNGYHFVFLSPKLENFTISDDGGISRTKNISTEDLKWLKNDLKKNTLPTIICYHYGIAEDDMKGNWWFEKDKEEALLENRNELKEILESDKNIVAVFSGHQHWTKEIEENNIKYFIVGSLVENVNNDGIPDGIFLEVDIKDKNMEIKKRHISM